MTSSTKCSEEAAFSFYEGIMWVAYRTLSRRRPEALYVEGWDVRGKSGGERLATIRRCMEIAFSPKGGDLFPKFVGCDQVYLDDSTDPKISVVVEEFCATHGMEFDLTERSELDYDTLNKEWKGRLGEDIGVDMPGYLRAVATLDAGI